MAVPDHNCTSSNKINTISEELEIQDLKGTSNVQWELSGVKIGINRSILMSSLAGKSPLPCPKGKVKVKLGQ